VVSRPLGLAVVGLLSAESPTHRPHPALASILLY